MRNPNIASELERTARPALFLQRTGLPVPLEHPARSYFGGLPRLPAHLAWPVSEIESLELDIEDEIPDLEELEDASRALFFAAQIDLAELAQAWSSGRDNPLPRTGTLYFFFDANSESLEGHETRVLYYEGAAHELPEREPPPNLWPYGDGAGPWPWLEEDESTACIGFKHPIRFIPFTSYCDHLEGSGTLALELQSAELDATLPLRSHRASYDDATTASWPFAWPVIAHLARAVLSTVADQTRYVTPSPELLARLQEITARAGQWQQRAQQQAEPACDRAARQWFEQEWSWLRAAIERASQHPQCSLTLRSAAMEATRLTCFELASESPAAADLIPEPVAQWLDEASKREPPQQRHYSPPPVHQILGHGTSVQSAPKEHARDVLLLQIGGEEGLAWFHTIGCVLQFWITPEALARRDFDHASISLDCS